jgi:hypothetical protein
LWSDSFFGFALGLRPDDAAAVVHGPLGNGVDARLIAERSAPTIGWDPAAYDQSLAPSRRCKSTVVGLGPLRQQSGVATTAVC